MLPVPLIWAAAAAIAAVLGAGGALWIYESAKGKRVVLLGPRKSGKTTLATFLHTGEIPKGYTPTQSPRQFEDRVSFEDLGLRIQTTDVSGGKPAWGVWKEMSKDADLVCFLAAWPTLEVETDWNQVYRAALQVGSWQLSAKTALIITFTDLALGRSSDQLMGVPRVKQLRRLLGEGPILLVDQTDEVQRLDLGHNILELLK